MEANAAEQCRWAAWAEFLKRDAYIFNREEVLICVFGSQLFDEHVGFLLFSDIAIMYEANHQWEQFYFLQLCVIPDMVIDVCLLFFIEMS